MKILILSVLFFCLTLFTQAREYTLLWDAHETHSETTITGYNLYYSPNGTDSWANIGSVLYPITSFDIVIADENMDTHYYRATAYINELESEPSNVASVSNATFGIGTFWYEAETASVIEAPFVVNNGTVSQTVQTGIADGGRLEFDFTVERDGEYIVAGVIKAPNSGSNSFFFNVDAEPDGTHIWDLVPQGPDFLIHIGSWRFENTGLEDPSVKHYFNLTAGTHKLIVRGREDLTELDKIAFVPRPLTPSVVILPKVPENP